MKTLTPALAALWILAGNAWAQDGADAGLRAIADLAALNGQALACQDAGVARRAKTLMLAHAPKTPRYGAAFEEGTQQSFLATTRQAKPCPDTVVLNRQLDELATQLKIVLPATQP